MAFRQRLRRFAKLSMSDQWLIVQSACLLAIYSGSLRFGSLKRHTAELQHSPSELNLEPLDPLQRRSAARIGSAVAMSASAIPWHCGCLVQSLVVHYLLKRERIPGQMIIGVTTSAGGDDDGAFGAHAWVRCGSIVISGEPGSASYVVISSYAWD